MRSTRFPRCNVGSVYLRRVVYPEGGLLIQVRGLHRARTPYWQLMGADLPPGANGGADPLPIRQTPP